MEIFIISVIVIIAIFMCAKKPSKNVALLEQKYKQMHYDNLPDEFVVFDLETTGFSPWHGARIIEIAAIKYRREHFVSSDTPEKCEKFEALIHGIKVPFNITRITGITTRMLKKKGRDEHEVLTEFRGFVGDSVMVSYNIGFDMAFIEYQGEEHDIIFSNKRDCVLRRSRRVFEGLENYKLSTVAKSRRVFQRQSHRAMPDTLMAARVYVQAVSTETKNRKLHSIEREETKEKQRLLEREKREKKLAKRVCKKCGNFIPIERSAQAIYCSKTCLASVTKERNDASRAT